MKVTVVGGGAIGSLLSARLARSGCDVALLVRSLTRLGQAQNQIRLIDNASEHLIPVQTEARADRLGIQGVVILALKAHAIAGALDQLACLLGPETIVLTASNGIPWWFFEGQDTTLPQGWLKSVDPGGAIRAALQRQPLAGCVLFPAAQMIEPGTVRHINGNQILCGNPREGDQHAGVISAILTTAGFEAPVVPGIRAALWAKLVGNASINPLSVITGATIKDIATDANLGAVLTAAMAEIDAVGEAVTIPPHMGMADRLKLAASVGNHKTSMLQDFEAGRQLELSGLLGAVLEIARWKGVPTPVLDTLDQLIAAKLAARFKPN